MQSPGTTGYGGGPDPDHAADAARPAARTVEQKHVIAADQMDAFIDWHLALSRHIDTLRHERNMVRAIVRGNRCHHGLTFTQAELATIDHPRLRVHGTTDPVGSTDIWRRFTNQLPHGELDLVEWRDLRSGRPWVLRRVWVVPSEWRRSWLTVRHGCVGLGRTRRSSWDR
jgi:hypothetical protein